MTLAAPEHQEMNGQVEVTWRKLRTIAHSLMVHARILDVYINLSLMYMIYQIFPVLPINDMINEEINNTTPFKLATGTKPSVSHLRLLFCPCFVRKATAHVGKEALNMSYQSQKGFLGIFVEIPQHQKVYLVYIPSTRKIISSYDVVFDECFSSALSYTSQPYSEAMEMCPDVTCKPCVTSSREQTGNIITFTQFEEGNILTKTCNDAKSGDKFNNNSIMAPLLSKEEMDAMDSGDESDHDLISTEMLKLSDYKNKYWLKETLKDINNLINNQNFLVEDTEKDDTVNPCMDV